MKKTAQREDDFPTQLQLETELSRMKTKSAFRRTLRGTIGILLIVAAAAVLISSIFLPVLQISGSSMEPVLNDGEIVVLFKMDKLKTGDICSFTWNNRILNKRVIACPGDTVDIDTEGNITVNGELLDEPYVRDKSLGQCDVEFPVTVGKGEYFFAGDRRESSIDSRSSVIGNVPTEQIIGKIVFRVWPIKSIGIVG